jgi:hypothetical protein
MNQLPAPPALPTQLPSALSGTDAQLIWELVANISPSAEVCARYGLNATSLRAKMKDKMFLTAYREAKSIWNSDLNVEERVRVKARFMVEDGLADIFAILKQNDQIPALKLEAFEKLMKAGELGPRKSAESTTRPFSIVMQFADPAKKVTIDGSVLETTPSE